MLARYFALICSGKKKLPNDWLERIKLEAKMEDNQLCFGHVKTLVVYGDFMESMAAHIGCSPKLWRFLFVNPYLWFRLQYGAMIPIQFRLRGPHALPELASDVLCSIPVATPLPAMVAETILAILGWVGGCLFNTRPTSW